MVHKTVAYLINIDCKLKLIQRIELPSKVIMHLLMQNEGNG